VIAATTKGVMIAESAVPVWPEIGLKAYGQGHWTYTYRGHHLYGHTGLVTGMSSILVRLPYDGIGLMIMINDMYFGPRLHTVVLYALLDAILGLAPIDWEERFITGPMKDEPKFVDVPSHPRPAPKEEAVVGEYEDKGYGKLNLTRVELPEGAARSLDSVFGAMSHSSHLNPSLDPTLTSLTTTSSTPFNLTGPIYVTPFLADRGGSLVFFHFDGPVFNFSGVQVFNNITNPDNPDVPLAVSIGVGSAVIVEGEGIGMFGNFWIGSEGRVVVEQGVEEMSEVWFRKV